MLRDIVAPGDTPLGPILEAVVYLSDHLIIAMVRQHGPEILSHIWRLLRPFCPFWPVSPGADTSGTSSTSNGSTFRVIAGHVYRFTAAVPASASNPSHTITIPAEVTPLESNDSSSSAGAYIDIEAGDLSG